VQIKPSGFQKGTVAIHSILLHTGKVLCIELGSVNYTPNWTDIVVVDPTTGSVHVAWEGTNDPNGFPDPNYLYPNGHWLICSGHAQIDEGRILFSGGDPSCEGGAFPPYKTTLYDPDTNTWSAGPDEIWNTDPGACHPDLGLQRTRRFYPTVTRLFDDRLLITDGTCLCGSGSPNDFGSPDTPVTLSWTGAPE
jgi:hypothetical protein